jgi:hypothetical protein
VLCGLALFWKTDGGFDSPEDIFDVGLWEDQVYES